MMIRLLRRAGRDLRTLAVGADPAPPVHPRPLVSTIVVILVVGFTAIAAQQLSDERDPPLILAAIIGVLGALPLIVLWYQPLWAWRIGIIGLAIGGIDHRPFDTWPWNVVQVLVMIVVMFTVALREPIGVIFWAGLCTAVVVWVQIKEETITPVTLLLTAVLILGEQIQRRRRAQRDLREQAQRSEMLTERARIARELHDVVAHSMSLVAVRAETAPYRLTDMPEPAREEFLSLATTARDTLTELRRLLGVLRTDAAAARAPQPTLSDLDDLVCTMRQAGMDIEFSGVPVPPTMGLTVFRIVQEALSNAAQHAPGAPVRITVRPVGGELKIDVRNGPSSSSPPAAGGVDGHGLVGMRERVELLNGTFNAGRTPDGGYLVEARIPWEERPDA